VLNLNERIVIEIDPETDEYSVDFVGGVNLGRAYSVLKSITESIESGKLLQAPELAITETEEG